MPSLSVRGGTSPLLLLLSLLAAAAAAYTCADGTDYIPGDLPRMPVELPGNLDNQTAAQVCGSMCAAEPACAFSVLLAGGCDADAAGRAVCYLN